MFPTWGTNLFCFAWDFSDFSTESPASWETLSLEQTGMVGYPISSSRMSSIRCSGSFDGGPSPPVLLEWFCGKGDGSLPTVTEAQMSLAD